jgi:APA family basic amino acid/polyamine antiporter
MLNTAPSPRQAPAGTVGWFTALCLLVSNVVGSGLFTTTGFLARDLGDPALIVLLWAAGAGLALAGALSYSELGTSLPRVGGEYVYLSEAYGPLVGFLSGWVSFTVGFGAAGAAAAIGFAGYLAQVVSPGPPSSFSAATVALSLVWGLTWVHCLGTASGGAAQRALTYVKVAAILGLVLGAFIVGRGSWTHFLPSPTAPPPSAGRVAVSCIFIVYAYSGWNVAAYIAGEMADPVRALPRTMISGTLLVGSLYLIVNGVYLYALPVADLAQPPILPVAEKVARALFGPAGAVFIALLLCVSIAGAVSAMIWAGPRVYYAMACDGLLPALLTDPRLAGRAPLRAIVAQSLWMTVLILSGTFEQLVVYSGVALTLFSALAVAAVVVLRRRRPDLPRPFRVPLYPLTPAVYLAASLAILSYGLWERPAEFLWAIATILAGTPVYWLMRARSA